MAIRRATPLTVRLQVAVLEALAALSGKVPRNAAERPCRVAGWAWYMLAPEARAAVRDNLRHVLGRRPTPKEVISVFEHGVLNYWDTLALPHVSPSGMLELVDIHGVEHIGAALDGGRGLILASAHLGSVAFVGQIVPALGYAATSLVEPLEPPELFDLFARQREAHGVRMLPVGAAALRELLAALRRNEVVGLITDRDVTGRGPIIPFFDAPTCFPDGAAKLSTRTGAPILIAACARKRGGRFDAWFEPLRYVPPGGDTRRDVLELTRAVARALEYYIGSHSDQWTVFQKRWPQAQSG